MPMNAATAETDVKNDAPMPERFDGPDALGRFEVARIALRQHFEEIGSLTRRADDWFRGGRTIRVS